MRDLKDILSSVPQVIIDSGSGRDKLEHLWRLMGFSRAGMQTRVAADLAERWAGKGIAPTLPVDDPRRAAKRLEKCFNGETALPFDLVVELIDVFPSPFREAARVLVFPAVQSTESSDLAGALDADAEDDLATDRVRYALVKAKEVGQGMSALETRAAADVFDRDADSCRRVARALRALAAKREQG